LSYCQLFHENSALEVTIILHSEECSDLYDSSDLIKAINSRRMRWAEHLAPMGEMRNAYKILIR
jgi:hypothetical protein